MSKSNSPTVATPPPKAAAASPAQAGTSTERAPEAATTPTPAAVRRSVSTNPNDTGDQEAMQNLMGLAESLAGIEDLEPEPETEPKPAKSARSDANPTPPNPPVEEEEEEPDLEGSVIPDDDSTGDVDEVDGAASDDEDRTGKDPEDIIKKLDEKLFKGREKRRELTKQLESSQAEVKALKEQLAQKPISEPGLPAELGLFAQAKSETDIVQIEGKYQEYLDWLEDQIEEGGYDGKDGQGNDVQWDVKTLKQMRKNANAEKRLADAARSALKIAAETDAVAKKRYAFVFDSNSPHHKLVQAAVQETPALARLPNKSLVLGRQAVAMLLESGQYMLVKRTVKKAPAEGAPKPKPKPATPTPPAPPPPARPSSGPEAKDLRTRIAQGDRQALEEWAEGLIPEVT